MIRLLPGDCREVLATLPADSVHCVVTSPPYYGLRDYGTAQWDGGDAGCDHQPSGTDRGSRDELPKPPAGWAGRAQGYANGRCCPRCGATRVDRQIGLEATPDAYLAEMVRVFREVRRVLRPDGTCWVNIGDSYAAVHGGSTTAGNYIPKTASNRAAVPKERPELANPPAGWAERNATPKRVMPGIKPKDLLMMPARLALALQADGWWLRSQIVWAKPNPMPESVTDRPTSSYEMVYLLAKSARYHFDSDAVREDGNPESASRYRYAFTGDAEGSGKLSVQAPAGFRETNGTRNLRNVWTLPTHSFPGAHFATFPPALAERCIRAGTKPGDTVLDPFAGAGTTLLVADRLQRDAVGIELNPAYTEMAMARCRDDAPLFAEPSPPPAEPPEDARVRDLFAEPLAAD